jgi:hypothetical protein
MESLFSALNVAVFWVALNGGTTDLFCFAREDRTVLCSNGISAAELGPDEIRFSNMVAVRRQPDGGLSVSSGLPVRRSGAWIRFGDDRWVRRLDGGGFLFRNGPLCRSVGAGLAACEAPDHGQGAETPPQP